MKDVVVLERETVGSGTTSKAAGGIRAQFPTETEIRFSLEAIGVFERFQDEFGVDPGYKKIGYLFLVSDAADLRGYETRIALQRRLGVDVRVIAPDDAKALVPALRVDDLLAAVWGPDDGLAGPAEVTSGFARRARERGVRIAEGVQVTAIQRAGDRVAGVTTTDGAVSGPLVINAAGPSAARIARMAGVEIPVHPRRRHIFFTEPFPEIPGPVPLTTDRTSGFYFRKEMEQVLLSPGDMRTSARISSAATASSTPPPPSLRQRVAARRQALARPLAVRPRPLRHRPSSRPVVDLRGQQLAQEVRVEEGVVVERLGQLALLLELPLGEPEETDGEVVEHHLELQLGHELLHQRRVQALEK